MDPYSYMAEARIAGRGRWKRRVIKGGRGRGGKRRSLKRVKGRVKRVDGRVEKEGKKG